ncbi:olfactomedin-like protein 1 [Tympanuchus pallidicinctus]|uniref:olfactomedin-like protein 1 n=1 Tax=Tympanuchus pallidicinctus TaxID=109042 RepID=UPI00228714AE|nr:olfactomedin-like protein 1 [Tympanuchus pallidicinctus]
MIIVGLHFLLVPFLKNILGEAQYVMQDAALMNYIDQRILSLENRLEKCNQDILDYVEEFQDFAKLVLSRLSGLNSYKTEVKDEVENLLTRVERAQRDIDYFGSVRDSKTCVEVDEDLVKQQLLEEAEEKRKLKVMLNASCDYMLTSVKSLKIVKKTGDKHGSWMKDPGKKHTKIYLLNGTVNNVIFEFANIMTFMESNHTLKARRVILPFPWEGTGHIIYQGFLFYHRHGSLNEIIKFNIQKRNIVDYMLLPGAGRIPAYQLSPSTKIDFAIDEQGLWAIHAEPEIGGNLVITKINHITMSVEHTWDTTCSSKDAEAAFMACNTLYVVYNFPSGGTSRIQCVYDVLGTANTYEIPVLHFPKRQGSHSTIHYDPKEKLLLAWGDGSQIIYKLQNQKKA